MSLWEWHPLVGPIREGMGMDGSADEYRNDPNFDYSFACGACSSPITEMDTHCPACGEVVEWDKAPDWQC